MKNPGKRSNKVNIYDSRSYVAAQANKMKQGGFEDVTQYYTNCEIFFGDVPNIHDVRTSYKKLIELCNKFCQLMNENTID